LNAGSVGGSSHDSAQGIDLPDHRTLGNAAYGGIAGHLADGLEILGEKEGARPAARGQCGGLGSCVATPDHHHVVVVH
jgi:hypothetical protein